MSALSRLSIGAVSVGLCCLPLAVASAQQVQRRNPGEIKPAQAQSDADRDTSSQIDRSQPGRAGQSRQSVTANYRGQANTGQISSVESYLANCLLKKNQGEVEIGQFASEQSQNPQVKEFAQMLVKDHQKAVQKLQQIAGADGSATRTSATSVDSTTRTEVNRAPADPGAARPRSDSIATDRDTNESVTTSRTSAQGAGGLSQLAAIEDKIYERCKQALREELQQKSGAEFDECFVGAQIGGHMQMLAALEVLSQEGQGQVKQFAQEAQPTVQKHLEHAKQLAKQLKSGEGAATAKRTSPDSDTQR
jgi:putative membrane protein